MRSDSEAASEALRRGEIIKERKKLRSRRIYILCSAVACLLLIAELSFALPKANSGAPTPDGLYGAALFAGGSAGGYILMGVVGFVLGAVVVLFYKKNKKD